jgi:hypothetical protein
VRPPRRFPTPGPDARTLRIVPVLAVGSIEQLEAPEASWALGLIDHATLPPALAARLPLTVRVGWGG